MSRMTKLFRACSVRDSTFSVSFTVSQQSLFPTCLWLHKPTKFKFASVLLFIMLPGVVGEYTLGGRLILIISDVYIKTQLI